MENRSSSQNTNPPPPPWTPLGWIAQWDGVSGKYYFHSLGTQVYPWEFPRTPSSAVSDIPSQLYASLLFDNLLDPLRQLHGPGSFPGRSPEVLKAKDIYFAANDAHQLSQIVSPLANLVHALEEERKQALLRHQRDIESLFTEIRLGRSFGNSSMGTFWDRSHQLHGNETVQDRMHSTVEDASASLVPSNSFPESVPGPIYSPLNGQLRQTEEDQSSAVSAAGYRSTLKDSDNSEASNHRTTFSRGISALNHHEQLDDLGSSNQIGVQSNMRDRYLGSAVPLDNEAGDDHTRTSPATAFQASVNISNPVSVEASQNPPVNPEIETKSPRQVTSQSRKQKERTQQDPSKFKFKCNTCNKRFTRATTLKDHIRSHNNERRWACPSCPKRFVRLKDRNRHQAVHGAEEKFVCGRFNRYDPTRTGGGCRRRFARVDSLVAHLRTQKGWKCLRVIFDIRSVDDDHFESILAESVEERTMFRCKLSSRACQKSFAALVEWKTHIQTPAGRPCVLEWLIPNALKLLSQIRDESSEPSNSGVEQPSSPSQIDPQVNDRCHDDEAGEDPTTPTPSDPTDSTSPQPDIAATIGEQSPDRDEPTAGDETLSSNDHSELESGRNGGIFSDWIVVGGFDTCNWRWRGSFCVLIKCSSPLEGGFELSFGRYAHRQLARVSLHHSSLSSQQYLYTISCKIPQFPYLFAEDYPIRVYTCSKSGGVSESFFDVGMLPVPVTPQTFWALFTDSQSVSDLTSTLVKR